MKLKQNLLSTFLVVALFAVGATSPVFADDAAPVSAYVKPNITHESYGDLKVVVPLTNDMLLPMKLRNIANLLKAVDVWGGKVDVKVVMYAKGLAWLKTPDDKLKAQLDMLRNHGVQFVACNNSLIENGIDFHTLYGVKESDVVPSGFGEVAFLQARKGYVVDPGM